MCATVEERYQFVAGPFGAEGQGDGRESVDRIESEEHIVMLYTVRLAHGQN